MAYVKSRAWRRHMSKPPMELRGIPRTTRNPQFGGGVSRISQWNCVKYNWQREISSLETAFLAFLNEIARNTIAARYPCELVRDTFRERFFCRNIETHEFATAFLVILIEIARNTIAKRFPRKLARNPRFAQRTADINVYGKFPLQKIAKSAN